MNNIHPAPAELSAEAIAADPILHFFRYAHLPDNLAAASAPFCGLAIHIVTTLPRNAERSTALRKLLEAKDAAVRANIGTPPAGNDGFLGRLEAERRELSKKLSALRGFIDGGCPGVDDKGHVDLLMAQVDHMTGYLAVLEARLNDLGQSAGERELALGEAKETGTGDGEPPFDG